MPDDDVFSGDPEAVARGAQRLKYLQRVATGITARLRTAHEAVVIENTDEFGQTLTANYVPAAEASLRFMDDVGQLVSGHSGQTKDVASILDGTNTTATGVAGGRAT
ncbi:hypothetical protein KIH74_14685 [Kineosporia sp. J2-2]|uniref:PE family protein n=1 Tax=Kineosporia corallincola TaxID=2835133 RepID=A0ABS5TKS2_9ACTN|nr:hypothetical protein [Kineosporia corallincola]MBT0770184.1 hypothetical protein [Kineosporia corallincola]